MGSIGATDCWRNIAVSLTNPVVSRLQKSDARIGSGSFQSAGESLRVNFHISVCGGSCSGAILIVYRLASFFSSGLIWPQRTLMSSSTIRLRGFWCWARPNQRYARGKSRIVQ